MMKNTDEYLTHSFPDKKSSETCSVSPPQQNKTKKKVTKSLKSNWKTLGVVKKSQIVMWIRESSKGVVLVKKKSNQTVSKSFSYG